jgi:hypothetical protein
VAKLRAHYSQADYAIAFAKANCASAWRYFVPTSATQRSYAGRQFWNVQLAYLVGTHLILLSELLASSIDNRLLNAWYVESIGNLLLRAALFAFYFTRPPDAVANLRAVRFIPMLSVLIVGAHWAWTALLFVDPLWDFANFMTLTVFLLMSLATMGFVPASPAPMLTYWAMMWVPAAIAAWPVPTQGPAVVQFVLMTGIRRGARSLGIQIAESGASLRAQRRWHRNPDCAAAREE